MAGFLKPGGRQLDVAEKKLAELQGKLAASRKILDGADEERDQVAAAEHTGAISGPDASSRFAEIADQVRRHRDEVGRLGRLIRLSEAEIAGLERQAAHAAYDAAVSALGEEQREDIAKASAFSRDIKAMIGKAERLEQARVAVADARARAIELKPDGADEPEDVDEPDFPPAADLKRLAAAIVAGPSQPNATGAAQAKRAQRDRENSDRAEIARHAKMIAESPPGEYRTVMREAVPERLREQVDAEAQRLVDEERQRRGDRANSDGARTPFRRVA